jgi:hypothetical protein
MVKLADGRLRLRYHKIFGHPGMVAQMLRDFVAEPWLDDLDLDGMERLNAKFHAETGERREGDMIWRIPRRGGGGDTYLMLLMWTAPRSSSGRHRLG